MTKDEKRAIRQLVRSIASLVIHIGRAIRENGTLDETGAFNSAMLDCDEVVDGIEEMSALP